MRAANGNKIVAATPANVFWLTDFWGGGTAIVHDDRTMIFTSPLEVDRAEKLGNEVEVVMAKNWAEVPVAVMKSLGNGKMIVDEDIAFTGRKGVQRRPEAFL